MTNIEYSKHYGGEVTIKFFPASHRYQLDGNSDYLIGVTIATGQLDKSRPLMIWASKLSKAFLLEALKNGEINEDIIEEAVNQYNIKRDEAASKGSLVHQWCEDFIGGKNPGIPEDENVRNGILAFLKWKNENDVRFIFSEKRVYSKKHQFVGTADVGFTLGLEDHKINHMGDWKTSNAIYAEMAMQVSAYQEAESEEYGTVYGDKYILRLDKDTGNFESHRFPKEEHEEHFNNFLACLKLKQFTKDWDKKYGYFKKQ